MGVFKLYVLLVILVSTVTCRDPFEFNYEQPQRKVETNTKIVSTPASPSKWTIKEQGNQIMILENCEDGQLRAVEIPQYPQ